MKLAFKNTKKGGQITIFSYKSRKRYVSVCLELDIVKEGDNLTELNQEMLDAVMGHVETVCKEKLSDDLLNRPAPDKYWKLFAKFIESQKIEKNSRNKKKKQVGTLNILPIPELCMARR